MPGDRPISKLTPAIMITLISERLAVRTEDLAVLVQQDPFRAQQPKDGGGGAQRRLRRDQKGSHVAGKTGQDIQQQVAAAPVIALQPGTDGVQGVHVETDVQERAVQQHGGEQPPDLALDDQVVDLDPQRFGIIDAGQVLA